jgi:hypothetical protein
MRAYCDHLETPKEPNKLHNIGLSRFVLKLGKTVNLFFAAVSKK